ncbi:MAG TPA: hypothetical protein DCY80_16850 [Solibacterales bacterium]|nr:hypothetical protein [Bryobacterales bacterium]
MVNNYVPLANPIQKFGEPNLPGRETHIFKVVEAGTQEEYRRVIYAQSRSESGGERYPFMNAHGVQ